MNALVDPAVRPSLVLAAGLLLHALMRNRSAALRHCILAGAIGASAAVVPLGFALPAWQVSLPTAAPQPLSDPPPPTNAPGRHADAVQPGPPRPRIRPTVAVVEDLWFAGFIAAATMLLGGLVRLHGIARSAEPVREPRWTAMNRAVARRYGLRRNILLLQTGAPDLLATFGWLRPRVLLPAGAGAWSDDRLRIVLSHELAHIARHDWLVQIVAEAVRTVLWFNPLIWIACAALRRESEKACDDAVLQRGIPARDYAGHLLELARQLRRPRMARLPVVPMARSSTLERRIADMLNPRLDRQPLSRRAFGLVTALLLAITVATAALRASQTGPAPLTGSIYDATGAVMPGVELTLEDASQVKSSAQTDATGRFEFRNVPPGHYVLAASIAGFRPLRQAFDLRSGADWDRAITLQVGDLRESITVSASRLAPPPAPSQPQFAQPVRVGGNVRAPRKLVDVRPVYPASMRATDRGGIVPLEAIIGRDGTVTSVRVLSADVHPDFAIAAADAVRQWRFSPTLLNRVPVDVVITVQVEFRLDQ